MTAPCRKPGHPDNCCCGEAVFRRLPLYVTEKLTCHCDKNTQILKAVSTLGIPSLGTYCVSCNLPHRYSVVNLYFSCEACNRYYTPDFNSLPDKPWPGRIDSGLWLPWPPPNLLCRSCDVRPAVPAGTTRKSFTFN